MRLVTGVTKDGNKKKPSNYKFYDFTEGGMDIIDQFSNCHLGYYTCNF